MTWLRSKTSAHTRRAYRKEAERFLLWAVVQKNKPLSSMTLEDCLEYRDFLLNPTPADRWCGACLRVIESCLSQKPRIQNAGLFC